VCRSCLSSEQREFPAEINIHFPPRQGLNKPALWVFPLLHVCLQCGSVEFALPAEQLRALADGMGETEGKSV
jgi:hypothetical protein